MKGTSEWLKKLDKLQENFAREAGKVLTDESNLLLGDAKKETPVDEGALRAGWQKSTTGRLQRRVYNLTPYAEHVEYGHRVVNKKKEDVKTNVFDGKTNKILNTAKVVRGRYMLHKAINKGKKRFPKALNELMKKLTKAGWK